MSFKFEELHTRILGIIRRWQTGRIDLVPEPKLRELNCIQGDGEIPNRWVWFDELPLVGISLELLDIELHPIAHKKYAPFHADLCDAGYLEPVPVAYPVELPWLPFYRTDGRIVVIEAPTWKAGKKPPVPKRPQPDGPVTWLDSKGKPIAPAKLVSDLDKYEYTQAIHVGDSKGKARDSFTIVGNAVVLAPHWRLTAKGMEAATGGDDTGTALKEMPHVDSEEAKIILALRATHPVLMTLPELETKTRVTSKTVGGRIARLMKVHLVDRPKGENGGAGLTAQGLELAAVLAPKITS